MHIRCNQLGIYDFSTSCRLYRILTQPVLTYCSEVWSPYAMSDLHSALHARLQVLQNDYLRQLGGLRGRVPALILARESCLQPLAFYVAPKLHQILKLRISCGDGLLCRALVGDLHLAASLSLNLESPGGRRCRAFRTWSGAWLRVLHSLSLAGGPIGSYIRRYLDRVVAGPRCNESCPGTTRPANWAVCCVMVVEAAGCGGGAAAFGMPGVPSLQWLQHAQRARLAAAVAGRLPLTPAWGVPPWLL